MTPEIWATAISTVISTVIASLFAWVVAKRGTESQEQAAINDMVDKMIDFSIQYPFLESDTFCYNWHKADKSENALRYENYCCFVFNLLERTWKHFKGDKENILDFLYVPEVIERHRKWWQLDHQNDYAYDPEFQQFVNSFIEDKP